MYRKGIIVELSIKSIWVRAGPYRRQVQLSRDNTPGINQTNCSCLMFSHFPAPNSSHLQPWNSDNARYRAAKLLTRTWHPLTSSQPDQRGWALSRTGCQDRTRCPPRSCRRPGTRGSSSAPSSARVCSSEHCRWTSFLRGRLKEDNWIPTFLSLTLHLFTWVRDYDCRRVVLDLLCITSCQIGLFLEVLKIQVIFCSFCPTELFLRKLQWIHDIWYFLEMGSQLSPVLLCWILL